MKPQQLGDGSVWPLNQTRGTTCAQLRTEELPYSLLDPHIGNRLPNQWVFSVTTFLRGGYQMVSEAAACVPKALGEARARSIGIWNSGESRCLSGIAFGSTITRKNQQLENSVHPAENGRTLAERRISYVTQSPRRYSRVSSSSRDLRPPSSTNSAASRLLASWPGWLSPMMGAVTASFANTQATDRVTRLTPISAAIATSRSTVSNSRSCQ